MITKNWRENISEDIIFHFPFPQSNHRQRLRIHWRLSANLKTSNKSVWSNFFFFLISKNMYILKVYSIHCTLRWNTNFKKIPPEKINSTKKCSLFFFRELQLITVLRLICDSYMSWSTRFVSLKRCVGFSIFNSVPFSIKFISLFNKMHGLFHFKTS